MLLWWIAVWTGTAVAPTTTSGTMAPQLGLYDGAVANPGAATLGTASGGTVGT